MPPVRWSRTKHDSTGTISTYSHDEQVVRCVSPAVIDQRALKDVALNVAQNGQDFVLPLRFNYYAVDKLAIHELQPHGGPMMEAPWCY